MNGWEEDDVDARHELPTIRSQPAKEDQTASLRSSLRLTTH